MYSPCSRCLLCFYLADTYGHEQRNREPKGNGSADVDCAAGSEPEAATEKAEPAKERVFQFQTNGQQERFGDAVRQESE